MKAHEGWIGVVIVGLVTGLVLVTSQPLRDRSPVYAGSKKATAPARAKDAVIGYLQTRDHRITIYPGGVYTVATKDGKLLAEKVTLDSLKASNPSLHQIVQNAVASRKGTLDARVDLGAQARQVPGRR